MFFHIPVLSIVLLFVLSNVSQSSFISSDCSADFFSKENACNSLTLDVIREWAKYKPMTVGSTADMLSVTCMKALECTKSLNCPEKNAMISTKIAELAELCSGIRAFSGSFGKCLEIIRSRDMSDEYPCLVWWNNSDDSPTCEFFTTDYECAEMMVENQCGGDVLKSMRRNKSLFWSNSGAPYLLIAE
uniref:DUF19 domain-containing protein n=1 Tax=Caenorhabditis japonica TaxID=281687 RepID=A0A8R1IDN1_CAEJA